MAFIDTVKKEKAVLVGIYIKGTDRRLTEESLQELNVLAETTDIDVVHSFTVPRNSLDPSFVIGVGKAEEILDFISENNIQLIIFDEQLSPIQGKNLSNFFKVKILDRVEIILDIFAKRAKTNAAKLQVELAQLVYLYPRLTRMWRHLSKQIGVVGVRGPGETQLEIDRRRIREKIHLLKKKLEEIRKNREVQRKGRTRQELLRFALVGYTNAGKTTLLNQLTNANGFAEDLLFCTLDPLSKKFSLPNGQKIIITDTVGFIRNLPHIIVESFHATLEEVTESDCLLLIIDGSDENYLKKMESVHRVLSEELKLEDKPKIYVINKSDLIPDEKKKEILEKVPASVFISAQNQDGMPELLGKIIDFVKKLNQHCIFFIPMPQYSLIKYLYAKGVVLEEKYQEDGVRITAMVNEEVQRKLKEFEIVDKNG